jgi:hypothetical protein
MIESETRSTWKSQKVPRGKHHNKTDTKTTVSLYLDKSLVEMAKMRGLNLSRVTEQALSSILDYMDTQSVKNSQNCSVFLSTGSFPKESVVVPRAGFEPATTRSSAERSPRLSYLGTQWWELPNQKWS